MLTSTACYSRPDEPWMFSCAWRNAFTSWRLRLWHTPLETGWWGQGTGPSTEALVQPRVCLTVPKWTDLVLIPMFCCATHLPFPPDCFSQLLPLRAWLCLTPHWVYMARSICIPPPKAWGPWGQEAHLPCPSLNFRYQAHGGTLFREEIGETENQKLLRGWLDTSAPASCLCLILILPHPARN